MSSSSSIRTLGILGGGQLGKMFCEAAHELGFRTHVYAPEKESPAFASCSEYTQKPYEDAEALAAFAAKVDAITFEFENIPVEHVRKLTQSKIYPHPEVLHICQNRGREKVFLSTNGFKLAPFLPVTKENDLEGKTFTFPGVLKTAGFGYDGKGQTKVHSWEETRAAFRKSGGQPMVLEQWIEFSCEVSVMIARDLAGNTATWGVFENRHARHILDVTLWPSNVAPEVCAKAEATAKAIAERLDVIGLIAVEFFVTKTGEVLVNELAPRAHNSGHVTMNASKTSQFAQHVRAISGLPLAATECVQPGAMANLLGDLWHKGEPNWKVLKNQPDIFLHLYGKKEARPGRKMGHINVLAATSAEAATLAVQWRKRLIR